jgi:hypothetical protein
MDRDIARRDFLSGVNIAVTGSLLSAPLAQALAALEETASGVSEQMMPGYYPPTRTGLRGSHPGSFEVAHSLRDGEQWNNLDDSADIGEEYDLVVVGGGGFDPARDIKAITVNRWPHGYAVGYDAENDDIHWFTEAWPDEKKSWLQGRKQVGRIAFANSDAAASAMTESAIEQGYRATQEILGKQ